MEQFVPNYRKQYDNKIVAALKEQFNYSNVMQVPKLEKIVSIKVLEQVSQTKEW